MLVPGPVPQLPVHVIVFRPQPFGSVKPSCSPVRLAPNVLLASNVSVLDFPFHAGSMDCTDAKASTRPAPNVLSAGVLSATALPTSRLRTVVRAVTAEMADVVRSRRHGALWSSSAAMAPTCGAAAEVPKNGAGNDPAPALHTPSVAAPSGLN